MEQHRIVPFYKAYKMPAYAMPAYGMPSYELPPYAMPGYMPLYMAQENDLEDDLEYLQEIFPEMSRRYAAKIASVVDRLDYKGSMIYDEYPDRLRLQRLSREILETIEKEAAGEQQQDGASTENGMPVDLECREELIYVLLCYEIAKRRHGSSPDMSKFYGRTD